MKSSPFSVMHDCLIHRPNWNNHIDCSLAIESTWTIKYKNTENLSFSYCIRIFPKLGLSMFIFVPCIWNCIGFIHSNGNNSNYQTNTIPFDLGPVDKNIYRRKRCWTYCLNSNLLVNWVLIAIMDPSMSVWFNWFRWIWDIAIIGWCDFCWIRRYSG